MGTRMKIKDLKLICRMLKKFRLKTFIIKPVNPDGYVTFGVKQGSNSDSITLELEEEC